MKLKLVTWWRSAWRLTSVQLSAVAAALSVFLAAFPDAALQAWLMLPEDMKQYLPPLYLRWITAGIVLLSIWARLVAQPKTKAVIDQKLVESGKPSLQEDLATHLNEGRDALKCLWLTLLAVGLLVSHVVQAQTPVTPTGTLLATPTSGVGSVTTTLGWDIKDAVKCTASGAWSGDKPVKGSEIQPPITSNASYVLTCDGPAPVLAGKVTLNWTAPTQNVDNSPLTNLAGFKIYYNTTEDFVKNGNKFTKSMGIGNPGIRTYMVTLPVTEYTFSITASNSAGNESTLSKTITDTPKAEVVETPRLVLTANVTVSALPPPTELHTIATTAYRLDQALDAIRLVDVGSVPLGTKCDSKIGMVGLYRVDRATVTVRAGMIRPNVALAKCE